MDNLSEIYDKILRNRKDWNYYYDTEKNSSDHSNKISTDNILTNEVAANSFLHSYFEAGGKEVFDVPKIDYLGCPHKRNIHTISVFLLGIKLSETLDKKMMKDELFIWFLICLYHDMGYVIEKDNSYLAKAPTLDKFMKLIDLPDTKEENNIFSSYHQKTLCKNYYRYIKNEFHHIDHGISGGILLYKKLIDNYYNVKKKYRYSEDIFTHKHLCYSKELFPKYELAAKTIIEHNMWFATSNDKIELYKKYGLDKLIPKENKGAPEKIKLTKENKFYFLLSIADTIEPTKKYENVESECVFKKIGIHLADNKLEISVLSDCLCHEEYYESIKSLENWLDISTNIINLPNDKKSVILTLPKI